MTKKAPAAPSIMIEEDNDIGGGDALQQGAPAAPAVDPMQAAIDAAVARALAGAKAQQDAAVAAAVAATRAEVEAEAAAALAPEPVLTDAKRVRIVLEEVDDVPPTGLFLGINGRSYLIRPGEEVDVPEEVVHCLNDAVTSTPRTDANGNVVDYRNRLRFPYRLIATVEE